MATDASQNGAEQGSPLSTPEAFVATWRAYQDLEAMGISDFDIFNALADHFYRKDEPEISRLMAEAAYQCFQRD